MYLPAAAKLAVAFEAEANEVALAIPSYLVGVVIGQLVHGSASDLYGRKRPLCIGLLIYTISSFVCMCVQSIDWFLALRFFQGLGGRAGMVLARAMVHDSTDLRQRARTFSILMLTASAAPLFAPLGGAGLLELGGWRAIFGAMGSIGLALLLLTKAMPETLDRSKRTRTVGAYVSGNWFEIVTDRQFNTWALSSGLLQGGMFAYFAMSATVFIDVYGLSPRLFSIAFAANSLGMVIAAQINARLIRRLPLVPVVRWALWASLVPSLALACSYEKPPALLLFANAVLYLSTIGFVAPNSAAMALTGHSDRAGAASALLGTLLHSVGALSAAVAAHILPGAPVRALILVMSACSVLATLTSYMAPR